MLRFLRGAGVAAKSEQGRAAAVVVWFVGASVAVVFVCGGRAGQARLSRSVLRFVLGAGRTGKAELGLSAVFVAAGVGLVGASVAVWVGCGGRAGRATL